MPLPLDQYQPGACRLAGGVGHYDRDVICAGGETACSPEVAHAAAPAGYWAEEDGRTVDEPLDRTRLLKYAITSDLPADLL